MWPKLEPVSGVGNAAWGKLVDAKPSRSQVVLAVVGAGTAYIRSGGAGGSPTAGLPLSESMGWVSLNDSLMPGLATRELWIIAPAGMLVRGFGTDWSVRE